MKKTITTMAFTLGLITAGAQVSIMTDFETFTLSPNSAYSPTTSTPFQTTNAIFDYKYAGYWSAGFAYTNKKDSVNGTFTNLYGVRAYNGYAGSDNYVACQDRGRITLTVPQSTVAGFYITNTTYAFKSIKSGDSFARRFGDTTGTGSGTTIPQGSYPDYFKVIVKGYKNGVLKNDSVTFMLADYTFTNNAQDFVLDTWQFVNTAIIGEVDSIKFFMRSTDMASWGMNTPGFFAMDNFTVIQPTYVSITKNKGAFALEVAPNPFANSLNIRHFSSENVQVRVSDISGKIVYETELTTGEARIDLGGLQSGVYFLNLSSGKQVSVKKIIKE
jgi:hypothetical protein